MSRDWKHGDVGEYRFDDVSAQIAVVVEPHDGRCLHHQPPATGRLHFHLSGGGWVGLGSENVRPLIVIDPEDTKQVVALRNAMYTAREKEGSTGLGSPTATRAALREFANPTLPKPYTTHTGPVAPWPVVNECHGSQLPHHECPQCAWVHQHVWVAWPSSGDPSGVPVRCSKCGGRKCDREMCGLQRHHDHRGHDEGGQR